MKQFTLRFNPNKITDFARRYEYENEDIIISEISPRTQKKKFLNKNDFLFLCAWKTPRTKPLCSSNLELDIKEITSIAFKTRNEKLKIEILLVLNGVNWPTASTLLHFGTGFSYPILDYRAIWSLGIDSPPNYSFNFWWSYTETCRKIAGEHDISLRILDRALWQYSKENQ